MFEERTSFNSINNINRLEDGLLQKIINLSLMNLHIFDPEPLSIIAIKSLKSKHRLFMLSRNEQKILDAGVVLAILGDAPGAAHNRANADLLTMSIMYAAKYYAVDFYPLREIDLNSVKEEFRIDNNKEVKTLICLGYFDNCSVSYTWQNRQICPDLIKEI